MFMVYRCFQAWPELDPVLCLKFNWSSGLKFRSLLTLSSSPAVKESKELESSAAVQQWPTTTTMAAYRSPSIGRSSPWHRSPVLGAFVACEELGLALYSGPFTSPKHRRKTEVHYSLANLHPLQSYGKWSEGQSNPEAVSLVDNGTSHEQGGIGLMLQTGWRGICTQFHHVLELC